MTGSAIIVGLDVGTTKICAVAAQQRGDSLAVLGMGLAPCTGLRKGIVISIEEASEAIRKAVREAEKASGTRITSVTAGISGGHIQGMDSAGAVGIRGDEVSERDIEKALESAESVYLPLDREVIHSIPTEFILDGEGRITDPLGMSGMRLEAKVHIISGAVSHIQNLMKCCEKAGIEVDHLVFEPIASAYSTLTRDEKEAGVALVDIGGGTTDIAIFKDEGLRYASVIGVGGNHLTNDISVGLRVPMSEAERLKRTWGAASEDLVDKTEEIEISGDDNGTSRIPRRFLPAVLQPRCEEMLEIIRDEIRKAVGHEKAISSVVLTGGSSLLQGFNRMAGEVIGLPVRTASPHNVYGLNAGADGPLYSTGIGLVQYEAGLRTEGESLERVSVNGVITRWKTRIADLLRYADYLSINNKKKGAWHV